MAAGLVDEIRAAWPGFRASMARQLAAPPREERLLFYVFLGCFLGFIAGLPGAIAQARLLEEPDAVTGVVAGRIFAAIFFAPLFLYGVAAVSVLAMRLAGKKQSFYTGRLALFWAILVAMPVLLGASLIEALVPVRVLAEIINLLAFLAFVWIWASCLAQGFEVKRTGTVAVGILFLPVLLSFAAFSLR